MWGVKRAFTSTGIMVGSQPRRHYTMTRQRGLRRAIKIAGGQSALARKIGVKQSTIWFWLMESKRGVPAEFVLKIEKATGVSRHELRPDIWPEPER
jgi:DNA-binding transcriptional regulator YdaS (Cro superfamily)